MDGDGNKVDLPLAKTTAASTVFMGDTGKYLKNTENSTIAKDDYFIVTDGTRKRGERKTYVLQYKGADKISADNPTLKFKNLGDGKIIEQTFSAPATKTSSIATINVGGASYKVFAADDPIRADLTANDFDIRVDMDRSGTLNNDINSNVIITTSFGAEINITNQTNGNSILLSIRTPDDGKESNAEDNTGTLYASVLVFNITVNSGNITHTKLGNLNFKVPSGQTNVEYAYTSYGAYIKREFPIGFPAVFEIDYPSAQREALVYYESGGIQSKLLTNLSPGQRNLSIKCRDIFENVFNTNLAFNYTKMPLILNVSPANNSYNVSVSSDIILNFRKRIDASNLKANILVKELGNSKVTGMLIYNEITNQTIFDPVNFLKFNTTYLVNATRSIRDFSGNSMESDYFWTFTTAQQDTDNDGIPDHDDNDMDNDEINDSMDFFRGNLSNINSNFFNLSIMIDSDSNTSKHFNETRKIEFYRGDIKLLHFDFNFSNNSKLDLSSISILNASNSSLGGVIIKGIPLAASGFKKTALVERIDGSINGLCIKDEEIEWIDNISDSCDALNEYKMECDATLQNGYTCTYNSTINSYEISGLLHSGAVQLDYTKSSSSSSSSGSSGSSGGSSGGGGGGGAAGFICNMEWKCSEWSACEEGSETRQCNFVKVPQHWQETQCPILSDAPINSQKCEVKIINPATTIAETKDQSNPISAESSSTTIPQINGSANQITGNFIARLASNPKAMKELIIGASIMATAVFGIFGYKFAYKRKQSIK